MDDKKICEGCGKIYYPAGEWIHEKCGIDLKTGKLVNPGTGESVVRGSPTGVIVSGETGEAAHSNKSKKQRWDREKYRANHREYMRKWRKK